MASVISEAESLEQVRTVERARIGATRINDADGLAPLLDDDLIYINSVGDVYDKESYLNAIRSHKLTYKPDLDVHEMESRDLDGFVILSGIMVGHARLDGEQQVFNFRYLSVWRRRSGDWRLVAWQSSSLGNLPAWHAWAGRRLA